MLQCRYDGWHAPAVADDDNVTPMVRVVDWLLSGSSLGDGVGLCGVSTLPRPSPAFSIAFLFAVDSAKPRALDRP